jgi:hypothetical protein
MSDAQHRHKSNRAERALAAFLQDQGFATERTPVSGSADGSFIGDHIGDVTTIPHVGNLYIADLDVPARSSPSTGAIMTTPYPRGRAGVAATAILQMVKTIPAASLQEPIEAYLRDEFAELDRQVAAERNSPDA